MTEAQLIHEGWDIWSWPKAPHLHIGKAHLIVSMQGHKRLIPKRDDPAYARMTHKVWDYA